MKRYLLGAALAVLTGALCPSPAHATNPSLLPFQQVPSGFTCGPAAGTDAATDVAAAGFSTCALGSDFTASTGTGWTPSFSGAVSTLSNWLDCTGSGTSSPWYWTTTPVSGNNTACSGHVAQVTDGSTLALDMTFSPSDISAGHNTSGMTTVNSGQTNAIPGQGNFPYGYYEWTSRQDTGSATTAFWSWVSGPQAVYAGLVANQLLEIDFQETLVFGPTTDMGWNLWDKTIDPNNPISTDIMVRNVGLPITSYHTWGVLFTGDGGSNFSTCVYVDGTRQSCTHAAYTLTNENLERRFVVANIGYVTAPSGSENLFIKSVKMETCSSWTLGTSAGMCPGSTLNGTGFYVP